MILQRKDPAILGVTLGDICRTIKHLHKFEQKNWSQSLFKRPNLRPGQFFEAMQQIFGANFGAKIEARPTFRPG